MLFLCIYARNGGLKRAWNHFWCLTEESSQQQNQIIPDQKYKTLTTIYKNSFDSIDENGRVNYKLQKRPFASDGEIPYELGMR
jgi:hypothetical protein